MKCQICNQKDAVIKVKQAVNGIVREIWACEGCAKKSVAGFQSTVPMLTDFLFGVGAKMEADVPVKDERSCPECHMRSGDFRSSSLLGCAACYDAFRADIEPMLEGMHGGMRHRGKVPRSQRERVQRMRLAGELAEAVKAQNFEEAARLRDRLKQIEPTAGEPVRARAEAADGGG